MQASLAYVHFVHLALQMVVEETPTWGYPTSTFLWICVWAVQRSLTPAIAWSVEAVHPDEIVLPLASFEGPLHSTEAGGGLMPILVEGWNLTKISANSSPLSSMLHFFL
jgi:hypothetical protein